MATLEFIFTKEYLATDLWFYGQLDANSFVAITQIAELPIVSQLTNDLELIKNCLKSSPKIVVDEATGMARPAVKIVQRTTIILRDVPESTSKEVKSLSLLTHGMISLLGDSGSLWGFGPINRGNSS